MAQNIAPPGIAMLSAKYRYNENTDSDASLLVFTDLDGTLLDEETYDYHVALSVLERLKQLGVPVIFTSSKTFAELLVLSRSLNMHQPIIAENGGEICIPIGYFPDDCFPNAVSKEHISGYSIRFLSHRYQQIIRNLHQIRSIYKFKFAGFFDWTINEIAELTGLSPQSAHLAKLRMCSEPILWQDTAEAYKRFEQSICEHGYKLVQGNRFVHVLGASGKENAMQKLISQYRFSGIKNIKTIALGDSPNDRPMLLAADYPVVIKNKNGKHMQLCDSGTEDRNVIYTEFAGPLGWAAAVGSLLDTLQK